MANDSIQHQIEQDLPLLIRTRRRLHAHPESGFREFATARLVEQELMTCRADIKTGMARTGLTAVIRGGRPGPVTGVRLDLDAVCLTDGKPVSYRSKVQGLSHACGHDVHTTIGLGLARLLSRNTASFAGSVKLVFQPSEELPLESADAKPDPYNEKPQGTRGAQLALQDGMLSDPEPDALLGIHCWPELTSGSIGYDRTFAMAGSANFRLTISGSGGHAATPHLTADPILTASQVIVALQSLVSRRVRPGTQLVLTVGTIRGGTRRSIIPQTVEMAGTVRAADPVLLEQVVPKEIERLIKGTCLAGGTCFDLDYALDIPPVINDSRLLDQVVRSLTRTLGKQAVVMDQAAMTTDDFAYMAKKVPAVYLKLGTRGADKRTHHALHSPQFDVDESCMVQGILALFHIIKDLGDEAHGY